MLHVRENKLQTLDTEKARVCSIREILEEFEWFRGMLEEFVREKNCSG